MEDFEAENFPLRELCDEFANLVRVRDNEYHCQATRDLGADPSNPFPNGSVHTAIDIILDLLHLGDKRKYMTRVTLSEGGGCRTHGATSSEFFMKRISIGVPNPPSLPLLRNGSLQLNSMDEIEQNITSLSPADKLSLGLCQQDMVEESSQRLRKRKKNQSPLIINVDAPDWLEESERVGNVYPHLKMCNKKLSVPAGSTLFFQPPATTLVLNFEFRDAVVTTIRVRGQPVEQHRIEVNVAELLAAGVTAPYQIDLLETPYFLTGIIYQSPGHFVSSFLFPDRAGTHSRLSWHFYDDTQVWTNLQAKGICTRTDSTQIGPTPELHPMHFANNITPNLTLAYTIYTINTLASTSD